jgi:hypothetical protein
VKISWEPLVYGGQVPITCCICGDRALPQRLRGSHFLVAVIYTEQGKVFGEACPGCANANPEEIQARLQAQIQDLKAKLADLETLANEPVIQTPSLEEEFNSFSWGTL